MSEPAKQRPALLRRPRLILVGSILYLALVFGVMLWRGISIEPEWVVLALLVIAVALGRGRTFIADWGPFLILFFAYEAMRGFASKTGFAPHDLSGLERWVFAGTLPTVTLQHAFYRPETVSVQDIGAMFFYFMHFPLPIVVGFVFWVRSRDHYRRFVGALLLMALLSFVTYLFWPSTPPWIQFKQDDVVHKILNETVDKIWGKNYIVSPLYSHLNPNQFAAFPSLHAAFPVLAAVYAWSRYRALALGLFAWTAAVGLSIVYLGEHYVVDILDGLLYVAAATIIVETVSRWRARRPPSPKAATPATPSA
ncbi:MAG TPA: phosphatase PAP2 family protein [Candidatus Dormibacteraeota bacterium]|nr:phosphatase PAP2 family protein [Candidatus Dormibacteraeota bacterium]